MPQVVRAFPLRAPVADLTAFAQALAGPRAADAARFYRRYGVERESWHLQTTERGPWVIVVTELADPVEAAPRYADATEGFHLWFKSQVEALTGVDPNLAPLGPSTRQVYAFADAPGTTTEAALAG
jgi:hypothetical protein